MVGGAGEQSGWWGESEPSGKRARVGNKAGMAWGRRLPALMPSLP
jgi:hypothetical protein